MYGAGTYAISAVKDIKVTDDYLGLDGNIRKCQSEETFEQCISREYLHAVQLDCNCVPYGLRFSSPKNKV